MPVDRSALETLLGASVNELGFVVLLSVLVILSSRAGWLGELIGEFIARRFMRPPPS